MSKSSVLVRRALLFSAILTSLALCVGALAFRLAYRPYLLRAARSRIFYQAENLASLAEAGTGSEFRAAAQTLVSGGGAVWIAEGSAVALMAGGDAEMPDQARAMMKDALGGKSGSRLMDVSGVTCLVCAQTLTRGDTIIGALLAAVPAGGMSGAALMWIWAFTGMLAAAAAAWPLSQVMFSRITQPIREIRDVAVRMAGGDFEARCGEYPGEVGELADSLNDLSHKLAQNMYALIVERNRLKHIINGLSEGIIAVSDKGHVTHRNPAIEKMYPAREVRSTRGADSRLRVIPEKEVWEAFDAVVRTGRQETRTIERKDMVLRLTISPVIDELGAIVGAVGLFSDVTQAEKLEKTRREYVANVSHEMRTPLTAMRALIEPLRDGMVTGEEQRMRYYEIIMREIMRLSRLINDQLELSRLQSGTLAVKKTMVEIAGIVYDLQERYGSIAQEKGLTFSVGTDFTRVPEVWSNEDRLEQLLVILLDNAMKYTEAGGLTLYADWDDDEVILHVKDTGIGISPENLEHVFDRFYKVDRAHSGLGSGLGLSIAKELLEFMGERIWVTSEPGKGSEFSFSVARREKAPDEEEGERPEGEPDGDADGGAQAEGPEGAPDGGAQENGQEDGREEKNDDSKDDRLRDTEA